MNVHIGCIYIFTHHMMLYVQVNDHVQCEPTIYNIHVLTLYSCVCVGVCVLINRPWVEGEIRGGLRGGGGGASDLQPPPQTLSILTLVLPKTLG